MRARQNINANVEQSPASFSRSSHAAQMGADPAFHYQPTPGQAAILQLQRTQGNAATVQRINKKDEDSSEPVQQNYVGGNAELTTNVDRYGAEGGETVAAGQTGYSVSLLSAVDKYSEDFRTIPKLETTVLDLTGVDNQIIGLRNDDANLREELAGGFMPDMGNGYSKGFKKQQQKWAGESVKFLENNKASEEEYWKRYNTWIPRANQYYDSFTRLEAMKFYLGVDDVTAMPPALIQGLQDAALLGQRHLGQGDDKLLKMLAGESLTSKSNEVNEAGNEMMKSWQTWKSQIDLMEEADAVKATGEGDAKRLEEINALKGKVAGVTGRINNIMTFSKSNAEYLMKDEVSLEDTFSNVNSGIKAMGGTTQLPTEFTGVGNIVARAGEAVNLGVELYFEKEVKEITATLESINGHLESLGWVSERIERDAANQDVVDNIKDYGKKLKSMEDVATQRRRDYLALGTTLDAMSQSEETGKKSSKKGEKGGKERYAQIMLVVSQVREMLQLGRLANSGATEAANNISPAEIAKFYSGLRKNRNNLRLEFRPTRDISVTASESALEDTIYANVDAFLKHFAEQNALFRMVDKEAGKTISTFVGGSGDY